MLIIVFVEILVASCSFGLSMIYAKVNDEEMPLYEISHDDLKSK
jgi:hypothetical protein